MIREGGHPLKNYLSWNNCYDKREKTTVAGREIMIDAGQVENWDI